MSKKLKLNTKWIISLLICSLVICCAYQLVPDTYKVIYVMPDEMKGRFLFEKIELDNNLIGKRRIRKVNQAVKNIDSWISSVGASIAMDDIDMDGYPDDLCLVDTRTDSVEIRKLNNGKNSNGYNSFFLEQRNLGPIAPMGCAIGDFNEDGYADVLVYYWGKSPTFYFRQAAEKVISRAAFIESPLISPSETWYTNAFTQADFNGDGHIDLFFGNYEQEDSSILDDSINKDGVLHHSMSQALNGGKNKLFLAQKNNDIKYIDKSAAMLPEWLNGWALAVGAADLNGDLLPELYISNDFGPDRLLFNTSEKQKVSFSLVEGKSDWFIPRSHQLGKDSFKGMGVDFADINNDGILDFYVSNLAQRFALRESHLAFISNGKLDQFKKGIAPYSNQSEQLGLGLSDWSWDAKFVDFDNDGIQEIVQATGFVRGHTNRWPELHEIAMGNDELTPFGKAWPRISVGDDLSGHVRNAFFVLGKKGRYLNIAEPLELSRKPLMTRGIAIGDPDGDGDQDMVLANQWQTSTYYNNNSKNKNKYLALNIRRVANSQADKLTTVTGRVDVSGTTSVIGAVVKLPDLNRIAYIDGGNGHSGDNSKEIHFGLENIPLETAIRVELSWLDMQGKVRRNEMHLNPGIYTIFLN